MQFALILSVVLHLLIVLLLTIGLPFMQPEPPVVEEVPIVVDLVQVAERTAAPPPAPKTKEPPQEQPKPEIKKSEPPKEQPRPEPQKPEPPKETVKPEPVKPPPAKEPPPPPPTPKEQPKEEPKKPEPKKPEPEKTPEKAPDAPPKKEEPKKEEPKKEEPKKEEPKKEEAKKTDPKADPKKDQKKPDDDDPFKDLVKDVEKYRKKEAPASAPQSTQQAAANPAPQAAVSGARIQNAPLAAQATMSEKDAIRAQVEQNWSFDPGAKGIESMVVVLRITINPDGSVLDVRLEPESQSRYNSDTAFRAIADGAIRATRRASPLKYPTEKYATFQTMVLSFTPSSRL
ncbi:TonB C-terminal domain-containing protein [Insolitispirillum peregrinum]|uniref:TonB C-terminal domain-containing protein n=1 Tax=Insolitispirillum peregrinum TaxID=80876 RepID=UPI0036D2A123